LLQKKKLKKSNAKAVWIMLGAVKKPLCVRHVNTGIIWNVLKFLQNCMRFYKQTDRIGD